MQVTKEFINRLREGLVEQLVDYGVADETTAAVFDNVMLNLVLETQVPVPYGISGPGIPEPLTALTGIGGARHTMPVRVTQGVPSGSKKNGKKRPYDASAAAAKAWETKRRKKAERETAAKGSIDGDQQVARANDSAFYRDEVEVEA